VAEAPAPPVGVAVAVPPPTPLEAVPDAPGDSDGEAVLVGFGLADGAGFGLAVGE